MDVMALGEHSLCWGFQSGYQQVLSSKHLESVVENLGELCATQFELCYERSSVYRDIPDLTYSSIHFPSNLCLVS